VSSISFKNIGKIFDDGTRAVSDFNLDINDGEFVVLVGSSGCGKSTLLRILAGLETATTGEIHIGDELVNERTPQQRNVAMVFQNYALYPHMTVRRNLEFPLKMMKLSRTEMQKQIERTARLLGLEELMERKPAQLSGGQRQRVAMGRAIVREPSVFLMDEPLSNLDAKLRVQIRTEIASLQQRIKTTTLYVTHDQVEAMTLGDRVAVISRGRLQQVAEPQTLYRHPANIFVAGFIGNPGMNVFETELLGTDDGGCAILWGEQAIPLKNGSVAGIDLRDHIGKRLYAGLRPEAFCNVAAFGDAAASWMRISAEIDSIEALGHESLVYFRSGATAVDTDSFGTGGDRPERPQMVARLTGAIDIRNGEKIDLGLASEQISLFDETGTALQTRRDGEQG
jgi:multiple sugar transport system ATP-binding protein